MAVQISFSISDSLHADVYDKAREHGLSVAQYARLVFLSNWHMDAAAIQEARIDDLDRREEERKNRDEARRKANRHVRRIDGKGWAQV